MEISLGSGLHRAGRTLFSLLVSLHLSLSSRCNFATRVRGSPLFLVDFSLLRLLGEEWGEATGWSRERSVVQAKGVAGQKVEKGEEEEEEGPSLMKMSHTPGTQARLLGLEPCGPWSGHMLIALFDIEK